MKIAVLGSKSTVIGFKLAGLSQCFEASENIAELSKQFLSLAENKENEIIIIDESCQPIRQEIIRFIGLHSKPVIVEVPRKEKKIKPSIFDSIVRIATGAKI